MSMTLLTTDLRAKNDMILLHLLTNQFVSVPVRLGGIGSSALEGYVEAFDVSNSVWSSVCDTSFDILDAHVICKMMGFNTSIIALTNSAAHEIYGTSPSGSNFVLDNLDCSGKENSVFECQLTGELSDECEATQIAGVKCSESKFWLVFKKLNTGLYTKIKPWFKN